MKVKATQATYPISVTNKAGKVTSAQNAQSATDSQAHNLDDLPRLTKLNVDEFIANYRNELLDARNPPDVVANLVNHQRRMFTDPAYFKQWNAAPHQEQQLIIHGNQVAGNYLTAYLSSLPRMLDFKA